MLFRAIIQLRFCKCFNPLRQMGLGLPSFENFKWGQIHGDIGNLPLQFKFLIGFVKQFFKLWVKIGDNTRKTVTGGNARWDTSVP